MNTEGQQEKTQTTQLQKVSPRTQLLSQISTKLEQMLTEQAKAMPEGFNQTRFLQNCIAVLADTKEIEKCNPMSIVRTLIKGAYLNLDFFRRECYAIPYGDVLNFQTDYKGEIKLCKKYGKGIKDIYAKLVLEGDDLQIGIENGVQLVNLKPKDPWNDAPIKGVLAVVVYADGTLRYETMSIKEIEEVRQKFSKAPNSPAWKNAYGEMCKKVALRRLTKLIDLHFDSHEQEEAYEEGADADVHQEKAGRPASAPSVMDPFRDDPAQEPTEAISAPSAKAVKAEDAELVESPEDAKLRADLMKQHPGEQKWQIDIRMKERKEEQGKK